MSESSKPSIDKLPDWLRSSWDAVLAAASTKSVLDYANSPAWKMLLEAAVVGSFLPRELAENLIPKDQRQTAEDVLVGFAELTQTPDGPRWSLSREARTGVLRAAIQSNELEAAIRQTSSQFSDLLSQSLRNILTKENTPASLTDSVALESARLAVNLLTGIPGVDVPPINTLESEIELRRIMGPFERMIGQTPAGRGESRQFFGRVQELEDLREYVGVISSFRHLVGRSMKAAARVISGWRPLSIWGTGGAGKSSLISKFMVEHAREAEAQFPFTYVDFDRPTISASNPASLLAEMCVQTGAQFKELSEPMDRLRAQLKQQSSAQVQQQSESANTKDVFDLMSQLQGSLAEFRRHIDGFLSTQGWAFELERPFLLVFDTFERVQYSEDEVQALEKFAMGLGAPSWSRLRLIISGRQRVDSFLGEPQPLEIGPLDSGSSADVLQWFAKDAGKPISRSDANRLVRAAAKIIGGKDGVLPLRLRLMGQQFKSKSDYFDGPGIVKSLLKELDNSSAPTPEGGRIFDEIMIRRNINHITDPRVRALANPGLIVRRITPDVIRYVMTKATAPPSATQKPADVGESTQSPQSTWIVDEKEARDIFEAFRREVGLVDRIDQNTLRHREDVRRQILPSLRTNSNFDILNKLAYDHYRARVENRGQDFESAEEAIYHGLWTNVSLLELNRLWPTNVVPDIDPTQFDKGSEARAFVNAKLRNRMTTSEISQLPPEIALEWLDARSSDLLTARNIQSSIDVIQSALQGTAGLLDDRPSTAATLACLMYQAGLWEEAAELASRHLELAWRHLTVVKPASADLTSMLRTLAAVIARISPHIPSIHLVEEYVEFVLDPIAEAEVLAHSILARAARSKKRLTPPTTFQVELDLAVQKVSEKQWKNELSVLRLVLNAGCHRPELLELWVLGSKQLPREADLDQLEMRFQKIAPEMFSRENRKKTSWFGLQRQRSWTERYELLNEIWLAEKQPLVEACSEDSSLRNDFIHVACSDFSDWVRPLGNALARALDARSDDLLISILKEGQILADRSQRRYNGVAIAQKAHEAGQFWNLAKLLAAVPSDLPQIRDVIRISASMFDWLDVTRRLLPE